MAPYYTATGYMTGDISVQRLHSTDAVDAAQAAPYLVCLYIVHRFATFARCVVDDFGTLTVVQQ
jgi:hypothetical protein